ncbi:hypothetical protein EMCRGX_G012995 [Ephydatia muelleri]
MFWDLETLGIQNEEPSLYDRFLENVSHNGTRCHPEILQEYDAIIRSQLESNIVELVEDPFSPTAVKVHYIPHHPMIRKDKATTKLLIVYDASAKTNGVTLNDCLYAGPAFGQCILNILLRFRVPKVAFTVEKAFLMISVAREDRDVLWHHMMRYVKEDPGFVEKIFSQSMLMTLSVVQMIAHRAYLVANDVVSDKRVAVFLSVLGSRHYSLLRGVFAPRKPAECTYSELCDALRRHYEPKKLIIVERFAFYSRSQGESESVTEFEAELRKLALYCGFDNFLVQALRDRLVCGLKDPAIQRRLLAESDLTLQKAMDIAVSMEVAEKSTRQLVQSEVKVQEIHGQRKGSDKFKKACWRCGQSSHPEDKCRFQALECFKCGRKGHMAKVCKNGVQDAKGNRKVHTRWVDEKESDKEQELEEDSDESEFPVHKIGIGVTRPYSVWVMIEEVKLRMEVDTGAAVSVVSSETWEKLKLNVQLRKPEVTLKTYTNEVMKVIGEAELNVTYKQSKHLLRLFVVEGCGPSLLGRNWLSKFRIDWKSLGIGMVKCFGVSSVDSLLQKYADLFVDEMSEIKSFKAKLRVKANAVPRFHRARPIPFSLKEAVGKELDRLETIGVLQKVTHSAWAAPIVVVPKKDGRLRICGDFKVTVNTVLDIDKYPLPKPDDLFAALEGGLRFTKLDLRQAYQQLALEERSQEFVTVNIHQGLYQFKRLPFGVASAPAIFQKFMDEILQGIPHVVCYLDDILISGSSDEEHLANLEEVMKRLKAAGVHLCRGKCVFWSESVEYLGHVVSRKGLRTADSKVEAVLKARAPSNSTELRAFLGLVHYYGKFMQKLAETLQPLNALLKKNARWEWTSIYEASFQRVKEQLAKAPVLCHYDPKLPLRLAGDASSYGVGAVLSHIMTDGSERPIAYASRSLSVAEKNYAQLEKEALSLVFGVKKFHQYLYGRNFQLMTDHKPLTMIFGSKTGVPPIAAARLQRWALLLSAYSYNIIYKQGVNHSNVDGLSRVPLSKVKPSASEVQSTDFTVCQLNLLPVTSKELAAATRSDPELSRLLNFTLKGWPAVHTEESMTLQPYWTRRGELTVECGCLLWGVRAVVPRKLQQQVLKELHDGHPGMVRMKNLARSYVWWPGLDSNIEELVKSCPQCQETKSAPPKAPLHPWVWPSKPWERIHVDFAGPFLGKMFFIIVDAHSKWPEVIPMSTTTSLATVAELTRLFASYGIPQQLVSDNGPQFTSGEFKEFLRTNGVRHIQIAPYHPSSNGAAERFVRTFKEAMQKMLPTERSSTLSEVAKTNERPADDTTVEEEEREVNPQEQENQEQENGADNAGTDATRTETEIPEAEEPRRYPQRIHRPPDRYDLLTEHGEECSININK